MNELEKIHVLLIDDDESEYDIIKRTAEGNNELQIDICYSETLKDGLKKLKKGKYDIVLLDIHLPDSSGTHGVVQIRKISNTVIILIFTGSDSLSDTKKLIDAGADDYILKGELEPQSIARRLLTSKLRSNRIQTTQTEESDTEDFYLNEINQIIASLGHVS
jgi:DNA-binding response OmpR family regulator